MTTALIIARDESGTFLGSYCNSDGYPSCVGRRGGRFVAAEGAVEVCERRR